jgi:small subunit ribosomal protein S5
MSEEEKTPTPETEEKEEVLEDVETTEEESLEVEKDVIESVPSDEEIETKPIVANTFDIAGWDPKTSVGKKVKTGEIKDIDQIINSGSPILESEIIEVLLPGLENDLLAIGQSKGKFGGGKRRVFKQTQKKSKEGNKPSFSAMAVVGNRDGYVGIGKGKSKDTVPSREKALRNAKLNVIRVKRGCGSWQCNCGTPHSIPFKVEGKCGSSIIHLMPAPKGKGLIVEPNCAKILELAGFKDVWSKTFGNTKVTANLVKACVAALEQLNSRKVNPQQAEKLGICSGKIKVEK